MRGHRNESLIANWLLLVVHDAESPQPPEISFRYSQSNYYLLQNYLLIILENMIMLNHIPWRYKILFPWMTDFICIYKNKIKYGHNLGFRKFSSVVLWMTRQTEINVFPPSPLKQCEVAGKCNLIITCRPLGPPVNKLCLHSNVSESGHVFHTWTFFHLKQNKKQKI